MCLVLTQPNYNQILSINALLNGVSQILELGQHPDGEHGDAEWTDKDGQHREDDTGDNGVGEEHIDRQYPHERTGYAEHPPGDIEDAVTEPDEDS